MDQKGANAIETNGFYENRGNELETQCLPTGECVFVKYENGTATCGIETANKVNKLNFKKPISCHLYPLRVSKVGEYTALNYHKWDICSAACDLGDKESLPVYVFLKEAITRAFGTEMYMQLDAYALSVQKSKDKI